MKRLPRTSVAERVRELAAAPAFVSALQAVVVLAVVVLVIVKSLHAGRDFWYDEAMLVGALRAQGWLAPWQPMSHYEQAAPWGVYLVQKLVLSSVGFQPDLLRIPGFLAYGTGALATWRAARISIGGLPALIAGVVAAGSLDVVQEAADFKHYIFEFSVAGVLLWLTARAARSDAPRRVRWVFVASAIGLAFSNTVVLLAPGLAVALWLAVPARRREVLWAVAGFLVAFVVWYFVALKPSTGFQLAYPTYRESSTVPLFVAIVQSVAQPSPTYFVAVTSIAAVGLVVAAVWRPALLWSFAPLSVALVLGLVGVATGAVPFSADRHVLFLVPPIALAIAGALRGIAEVLGSALPPATRAAVPALTVVAMVVVAGIAVTVPDNVRLYRQQVGQALESYRSTCSSFYVDWWTQPSTVLYAQADGISSLVHGQVDTTSGFGQDAWAYRVMDHPAAYRAALISYVRTHPMSCVLTGGRDDETTLVLQPLAAAGMPCTQIGVVPGVQVNRCRKVGV